MKKQTIPTKFKKLVKEAVNDYLKLLEVTEYRGDILYLEEDDEEYANALATAQVDHRYLTVNFRIYPYFVEGFRKKHLNEARVKQVIAHEVAHVATHKLFYLATSVYKDEGETKDAWEALTEKIGRLLYDLGEK